MVQREIVVSLTVTVAVEGRDSRLTAHQIWGVGVAPQDLILQDSGGPDVEGDVVGERVYLTTAIFRDTI